MGYSGVVVVLALAGLACSTASVRDNTLDGGDRVVLVAPVLAPPKDSRIHSTDRSRQFPILVLLAPQNPEKVREPEAKSLDRNPRPIYVQKLEDQHPPLEGRSNRQKRHLFLAKKLLGFGGGGGGISFGGGGGYGGGYQGGYGGGYQGGYGGGHGYEGGYGQGGQSGKTIVIVKEIDLGYGGGNYGHGGGNYGHGGGNYGQSGQGYGGGYGGGFGGGYGGGGGGGGGGGYGGGYGGGGGGGGGYGGNQGYQQQQPIYHQGGGGCNTCGGGGYGGSQATATATATATANSGSYGYGKR